ncbi:MAG: hypothetical protein BA863_02265 [Desulfovibrio sp. S3730MH75]|nr:MAG: hypothetical protein BA863_02265 [Desulfovibrio sp. S3730MH75]
MKHIKVIAMILMCFASTCAYAGEDTIRISTSYKTLLSTPDQTGMLDQIVKEAFRRIGIKSRIVFTPNERSLVAVNDGMFDAEINRVAGMEKKFPNLIQVPEANMVMHFVSFATKDISITDWESLRSLKVGIVRGWKILEQNTQGFPYVTRVMNADQLFLMLHKGRIDVALFSKILGYEWISNLDCDHVQHLEPPLASRGMFLYLHKNHQQLAIPVAEALREMKRDGTYDRIVQKTTGFLYGSSE